MRNKLLYVLGLIFCFVGGAYVWKVNHTSIRPIEPRPVPSDSPGASTESVAETLVVVGDSEITTSDLDFEYRTHTQSLTTDKDLTAAKADTENNIQDLSALKERLMSGLIERKILFTFIKQERAFSLDDPGRYSGCLKEWQESITSESPESASTRLTAADKERLKLRLCERAIIEQYLNEKVYASIQIEPQAAKKYYDEHRKEFSLPKRAIVRQIVLPTEEKAEEVKKIVNRHNFIETAKELSIAPEGSQGGLVGPFVQGEMPKFFDLAFSMAKGEIYGVIKSPYGYHIIMVEERLPAVEQNFEQAKKDIIAKLTKEKQDAEYKKWMEKAVNAVAVKTPGSVAQ